MLIDLHAKYGYCIVPKGTILFRGANSTIINHEMFFGTKYYPVITFGNNVQVWRTKTSFKVLFLIRHIDYNAKAESSLPDLYYDLFPNEPNKKLDDLDVKQDRKRRQPFAIELYNNHKVNGWFSSIENNSEVEVCLFNENKIGELIEFIEIVNSSENYCYDSLRKIKLFPNAIFLNKSKDIIKERMVRFAYGKDPYIVHRTKIRSWVKDYVENGGTEVAGKQYYYDLRTKLKF